MQIPGERNHKDRWPPRKADACCSRVMGNSDAFSSFGLSDSLMEHDRPGVTRPTPDSIA